MQRKSGSMAGLAGVLLAAGLLAVACGSGSQPAVVSPTGAAETVVAEATPVPSPTAAAPSPTFDPGTALGQVDADLSEILQILGGVDGSLSGADAGSNGGE